MVSVSTKLPAKVKLQKYLIHHKLAQSNRHVRKLINEGMVFVNGVEARSVSIKVDLDGKGSVFVKQPESSSSSRTEESASKLLVSLTTGDHQTDEANEHQHQPLLEQDANNPCILFYKPCGMLCTTTTTTSNKNPDLFDTTLVNISPPLPPGFHAVGRLDQHSHGLLLFSCDGRLTSALLSPKSQVPRDYTVIVQGDVGEKTYENIIQDVKNGVHTMYGTFKGCILEMKRDVDRDYVHSHCDPNRGCRKDKYGDTETCDRDSKKNKGPPQILSSLTIQVEEGKNRMVRRLFAALDLPVLDLRRYKYGGMELHGLRKGQWRYADTNEVAWCRKLMQAWNDGGKGWDIKLSSQTLD